jgi:thiol-disulfide isomerase/thioredoxin
LGDDKIDRQLKAQSSLARGSWRWLAAGIVLAAIVLILTAKGPRSSTTGGLAIADTSAIAAVPTLQTPADTASATQPQAGSWPADPAAQVDWVLENKKAALILFHSTNCKPCIAMTALVEEIRPDYAEQIVFVDVVTNDTANATLVRRAGIQTIPTTYFITSSGTGHGYIGLMKEEDVRAELDKLIVTE